MTHKFDLGDIVENDMNAVGRIVAIFHDWLRARRYAECCWCDRACPTLGYQREDKPFDEPAYLLDVGGLEVLASEGELTASDEIRMTAQTAVFKNTFEAIFHRSEE